MIRTNILWLCLIVIVAGGCDLGEIKCDGCTAANGDPADPATPGDPTTPGDPVTPEDPPEAPPPETPTDPVPPPPVTCTPSVTLQDMTGAEVVGDGTPQSCTEAALRSAITASSMVSFNCGLDPLTIAITNEIELPVDRDTTVDGGGLITLDAGYQSRHFYYSSPNFMASTREITLQRLTLRNGQAPTGEYFDPVPGYPECAYGYKEGSGGSVYVRDGFLRIIDCAFYDNRAALIGPDVGGGAVYALGAASVIISGSVFVGNSAANGGAVGMLWANPEIYNTLFENNTAVGTGQNREVSEEECPAEYALGHENQAGAGGLAGGVYFDGANDESHVYAICGSVFRNNRANELAGAVFRTPNVGIRRMQIIDSVFDANTASGGGVSFIKQNELVVRGSTFMNNRAGVLVDGTPVGGWASGLWLHIGSLDMANSSFYGNPLTAEDDPPEERFGTLTNVTFSDSSVAGLFTINNSLLVDTDCQGGQDGARNIQWSAGSACVPGATFIDPGLAAPADNGGPTPTMLPGNPAAVAGVGSACPAVDQRGETRASACAAGAVEVATP